MAEKQIEIPDFDEWIANYKHKPVAYNAAFDVETGRVLSVGPDHAVNKKEFENVIPLEADIAEKIISSEISMSKCFIDPDQGELEIVERRDLYKIDDVLHRIIVRKYSEIKKPDIYLEHNAKTNILSVELSEEFGGTYKQQKGIDVVKRKMFWNGETQLDFTITDYNDPNIVTDNFSVTINDLIGNKVELKELNINRFFSVYTRRLFKNYMIEER